jgi:hypothetical protein
MSFVSSLSFMCIHGAHEMRAMRLPPWQEMRLPPWQEMRLPPWQEMRLPPWQEMRLPRHGPYAANAPRRRVGDSESKLCGCALDNRDSDKRVEADSDKRVEALRPCERRSDSFKVTDSKRRSHAPHKG